MGTQPVGEAFHAGVLLQSQLFQFLCGSEVDGAFPFVGGDDGEYGEIILLKISF